MNTIHASTILNIGSTATFVAFPLLYSSTYNGSALTLGLGMGLVLFSMVTPFIALKYRSLKHDH